MEGKKKSFCRSETKQAEMSSGSSCSNGPKVKRVKREQQFLLSYSKRYPCIVASKISTKYARCTVCEMDFLISHGGKDDVERHVMCVRHKTKAEALDKSAKMTQFFARAAPSSSDDMAVIRAETLFAHFLVEHNIPVSAADHAGKLFRAMFPGNKIAESYARGRTKTTQVISACGSEVSAQLAQDMKNGPFILGTDGSQEGGEKLFPIVVSVIRDNKHSTELLSIPSCDGSATGENIFKLLDSELKEFDIPWMNCLSLVVDNANVMTGHNKGVISYVRKQVKDVHLAGCVCHLLHLAVKKGIKSSSKFDLDETLRQVTWYFEKSTCRQQRFQVLQKECSVPNHKLLQHVPTGWLSLGAVLGRILEQWEPLKRFFMEECQTKRDSDNPCPSVKTRLKDFFRRRTPKLYVSFYESVIEMFDKTNRQLQSENSRVHLVRRDLEQLFRRLLVCFVKPSALHGSLMETDFMSAYNVKSNSDLFIGCKARAQLEAGVDSKEEAAFFKNVKEFYQSSCRYFLANLHPSKEELWKHAEVADISLKLKNADSVKWSSVKYFLDRFPCLLPSGISVDDIQGEFSDYMAEPELPESILKLTDATEQWAQMSTVTDHNGALRFCLLSQVMLGILLIPVSNCACKRVFSLVRKNKTDFRGSMGNKTLNAVLQLKSSGKSPCHQTNLPSELLIKCKAESWLSLE